MRCEECDAFEVHKFGCSRRPRSEVVTVRTEDLPGYRDGYQAGLRRAQELAKEMIVEDAAYFDFEDLVDAIDAEVAKERGDAP